MINLVKARTPILALILFVFSIGAYAQTTKVVVIPMGDSGINYAKFSGPQRDLKQSLLEAEGWSICHTSAYIDNSNTVASVIVGCTGSELMLACRPVDHIGGYFTLAAYAPRADVLFDTGTDITTTHAANGSEWYYSLDKSWGFAPKGEAVNKNSCDYGGIKPDLRMCIHTSGGAMLAGWRCGNDSDGDSLNTSSPGSSTWERVVLQR